MIINRRKFTLQWRRLSDAGFVFLWVATCTLLALPVGAQQREDPAQVVLAAELRESPQRDAAVIASLRAGESVTVQQMRGAWSRVKANAGQGWVLSSRLQVGGPAPAATSSGGGNSESGGTSWLRGLTGLLGGSGNARRSSGNVTIGTRGLQSEDVAGAQPDQAAVAKLDRYVVDAAQASAKARAAGLQAVDFAYLDAPRSAPAQFNNDFNDGGKD